MPHGEIIARRLGYNVPIGFHGQRGGILHRFRRRCGSRCWGRRRFWQGRNLIGSHDILKNGLIFQGGKFAVGTDNLVDLITPLIPVVDNLIRPLQSLGLVDQLYRRNIPQRGVLQAHKGMEFVHSLLNRGFIIGKNPKRVFIQCFADLHAGNTVRSVIGVYQRDDIEFAACLNGFPIFWIMEGDPGSFLLKGLGQFHATRRQHQGQVLHLLAVGHKQPIQELHGFLGAGKGFLPQGSGLWCVQRTVGVLRIWSHLHRELDFFFQSLCRAGNFHSGQKT